MKKNKNISIVIGTLLVLGVIAFGYTSFNSSAPKQYVVEVNGTPSTKDTTTGVITSGVPTYTLADITAHKDSASCYTIVNNSVYDLTMFVSKHEGGTASILSMCGKDGTEVFISQHKGAAKIMRTLSRFKIGELS